MKKTRQSRLSASDPEAPLAETTANWRTVPKPFLSASALGSWSYCHTKPFIERLLQALGIDTETAEMRAGTQAHEQLQSALAEAAPPSELTVRQALEQKAFLYAHEYPLKDERRMLRGIADIVFAARGSAYVVELKNTVAPRRSDPVWQAPLWFEHGLQLEFYALMARQDFDATPHLALAYLKGTPKDAALGQLEESGDPERALLDLYATSAQIEATAENLEVVHREIKAFRGAEKHFVVPLPNHASPRRCSTCRVRSWCPRRLDQPGRFEAVPASRLEDALGR